MIEIMAIAGLTAIELMALYKNVNGKLLVIVCGLIGGLGGYTVSGVI